MFRKKKWRGGGGVDKANKELHNLGPSQKNGTGLQSKELEKLINTSGTSYKRKNHGRVGVGLSNKGWGEGRGRLNQSGAEKKHPLGVGQEVRTSAGLHTVEKKEPKEVRNSR